MTPAEAVADMAQRWAPRAAVPGEDVLERVALRLDGAPEPVARALPAAPAVRLFILTSRDGGHQGRATWRSRYVFDVWTVDDVLDDLLAPEAS